MGKETGISKRGLNRRGVKHTPETRALISLRTRERTQRGSDHYAWKGGTKSAKHGDRGTPAYREWRNAVFARDCHTCQICTVYLGGGDLEAHHCKPYAEFPELRFDIENGVTLCHYHHQNEVHDRG